MTNRRVPAEAENIDPKATGLTVQQARELLKREDIPVRCAVSVSGLLAFAGVAT